MSGKRRGQGSGGVYQRESDGLWVASVELGYEGDKRKRKYLYAKSQRAVIEKQTTALHAMQHALPVAFERQTVAQYLERWLAESVAPRLRPTTALSYTQQVRHHIIPALGRVQLAKLNPQQLQAFLNRKSASGLSPRTVQYIRATLRTALMQAMKWGLVARNVAQLVDAPKSVRKEPVVFTPAEARAFLAAVQGERWEALYTAALACGLRRGEALGLRWPDVDLDAGTIAVRTAYVMVGSKPRLQELKTERSRRTLALPAVAVASLRTHRTRRRRVDRARLRLHVLHGRSGRPAQP